MGNRDPPKVRWGVIGCGQIARDKALPALAMASNAEPVALADPDPARLERAQAAAPPARPYADAEALLADADVQAVYVATPNFLHAPLAIAAARAGKHVLVEKPMAMNAAEGHEMVAAADRAGVKLMAAYMTLFNPAYQAAKRAVEAGLLGEIVFVRGRHSYSIAPDRISSAAAWRLDRAQGGGPLLDIATYPTFTLRELTGQRIRSLSATAATRRLHERTDHDSVLFTFLLEDDTPGVIEATFTHGASLIELEGTHGRLSLSGHFSQNAVGRLDLAVRIPGQRQVAEQATHEIVPDGRPHFDNYRREIEHLSDCILADREPISSGRKAVAELVVTDAVQESLRAGRRVEITWPAN
ncbi:MAG TPA: Gfo/Idh/MocA family oxidoreductase [Chloroflexota bacterium]|jgi:predicted dehydrogenase|nr:Gfo/Idh/MocA family oxidoreductase [Chloroflexota bacterium]